MCLWFLFFFFLITLTHCNKQTVVKWSDTKQKKQRLKAVGEQNQKSRKLKQIKETTSETRRRNRRQITAVLELRKYLEVQDSDEMQPEVKPGQGKTCCEVM